MTRYFRERMTAGLPTPGVVIVPQEEVSLGGIIASLLLVWSASQTEEWRNQIVYLPFK